MERGQLTSPISEIALMAQMNDRGAHRGAERPERGKR